MTLKLPLHGNPIVYLDINIGEEKSKKKKPKRNRFSNKLNKSLSPISWKTYNRTA